MRLTTIILTLSIGALGACDLAPIGPLDVEIETPAPDTTVPAIPCADGQVAAGPYCVNPIYVGNPMFTDPATCEFGYYQGSCTPEPPAPIDLGVPAYTYQTP